MNLNLILGCSVARRLQHRGRSVDSGNIGTSRGKRDGEPSGPTSQLKNGAAAGRNLSLIKRQVIWAGEERVIVPRIIVQIPHSYQA
jgi:hypothetical protein